jgi:predicted lipase
MFRQILYTILGIYIIYLIRSEEPIEERPLKYFNRYNIVLMTEFSNLAYMAMFDNDTFWYEVKQLQKTRFMSLENIRPFHDKRFGIAGFMAESITRREILIGLSLSVPKKREDLDFVRFSIGGFVCHGFLKAWERVFPIVSEKLMQKRYAKVWMVGHSLGGAIATLGSATIKRLYPFTDVITYTFGSPPVGDSEFSQMYDALRIRSYHIQHELDIVPRFPTYIRNYRHVSTPILIHQSDNETQCLYNSTLQGHISYEPLFLWYNHSLNRYRELLQTCKYVY